MFDPMLYRTKEEVEEWKKRDPIATLSRDAAARGWLTERDREQMEAEIGAEIDDAVAFAEAGKWEPVQELTRFVHSEVGP
jgi:TPP-dependent pyruvate/acetoin dehydrogenase alpha subunit